MIPAAIAVAVVVWIVCGVVAYGATFADFQMEFRSIASRRTLVADRYIAIVMAVFGPIGIVVTAAIGKFKHGLIYRSPWTEEEKRR